MYRIGLIDTLLVMGKPKIHKTIYVKIKVTWLTYCKTLLGTLKVVNISLYTFEEGENVKVVGLTKIKGCLLKILSYSSTTRAGSIADLHSMTNEGLAEECTTLKQSVIFILSGSLTIVHSSA